MKISDECIVKLLSYRSIDILKTTIVAFWNRSMNFFPTFATAHNMEVLKLSKSYRSPGFGVQV